MTQIIDSLPLTTPLFADLVNQILSAGVPTKSVNVRFPIPLLRNLSLGHQHLLSLQSKLAKMFQGVVLIQMNKHIENYGMLGAEPFSLRPEMITEHVSLDLVEQAESWYEFRHVYHCPLHRFLSSA